MVVRPIEGPPSEYEKRKLAKTSPNRANLPCCLKHIESNPCVNRWAVEWANWEFVPNGGVFPRVQTVKKCPRPWDRRSHKGNGAVNLWTIFSFLDTRPLTWLDCEKCRQGFQRRSDLPAPNAELLLAVSMS